MKSIVFARGHINRKPQHLKGTCSLELLTSYLVKFLANPYWLREGVFITHNVIANNVPRLTDYFLVEMCLVKHLTN